MVTDQKIVLFYMFAILFFSESIKACLLMLLCLAKLVQIHAYKVINLKEPECRRDRVGRRGKACVCLKGGAGFSM